MTEPPPDFAALINARLDGWARAMGLVVREATGERVVADLEIDERHLQGYGIVHGGVHAGVVETLCSIGAALAAMPNGQAVVGLENHTSFLKAVRSGRLVATALPLTRGRCSQLWEGTVRDAAARTVAVGRVRLLCLEAGSDLAGGPAAPRGPREI